MKIGKPVIPGHKHNKNSWKQNSSTQRLSISVVRVQLMILWKQCSRDGCLEKKVIYCESKQWCEQRQYSVLTIVFLWHTTVVNWPQLSALPLLRFLSPCGRSVVNTINKDEVLPYAKALILSSSTVGHIFLNALLFQWIKRNNGSMDQWIKRND